MALVVVFVTSLEEEWIGLTAGLVLGCLVNVGTLATREIALLAVKIEAA